jgi:hypothetical protein
LAGAHAGSAAGVDIGADGAGIVRWYRLRSELTAFAQQQSVSAAGSKSDLTDRIAALLDDREL